jgi:hypothetical protein
MGLPTLEESARTVRTWAALALGDGVTALAPLDRLRVLLDEHARRGDHDGPVVLLTRHDDEGGLHCRVTAFFSPAAGGVARAVGALPCPRPSRAGLVYAAGDPGWEAALFDPGTNG